MLNQIKLCTKGSCCPTLQVDFDEDVVTFIDDDDRRASFTCAEYELGYRNANFNHEAILLGQTENSACISTDEYKLGWVEYWRMKSEYLATPTI